MRAEHTDPAVADAAGSTVVNRCGCGRLAVARCWLGESSPARWLVSCRYRLPPESPEAA